MSSSSALDLADRLIAIPEDLQAEFELVLHLVEHVAERLGGRAQQLDDVLAGLENRAERHRDDGVLAHHGLVDALVGEHVLARRVEDFERRIGDDGREVLVVDRIHLRRIGADADRPEPQRVGRLDDAVDVLPPAGSLVGVGERRDLAALHHLLRRAPLAAGIRRCRRPGRRALADSARWTGRSLSRLWRRRLFGRRLCADP